MDGEISTTEAVEVVKKVKRAKPKKTKAKKTKKVKKAKKTKKVKKAKNPAKRPYKHNKVKKPKHALNGDARTERLDMRLTKAEKEKVTSRATKLRRTVSSIVLEAIEKIR